MGWIRGETYLETCKGRGSYPPIGSLLEALLQMVYFRQKKAEYLQTLLLVKASQDARDGSLRQLWQDYTETAFPFIQGAIRQEKEQAQKLLRSVLDMGPLRISRSALQRPAR